MPPDVNEDIRLEVEKRFIEIDGLCRTFKRMIWIIGSLCILSFGLVLENYITSYTSISRIDLETELQDYMTRYDFYVFKRTEIQNDEYFLLRVLPNENLEYIEKYIDNSIKNTNMAGGYEEGRYRGDVYRKPEK